MKKILILVLIIYNNSIYSQNKIVGTVIDGLTKETLIGANIIIGDTKKGISTDFNGMFILDTQAPVKVTITYLGYKKKSTIIKNNGEVSIELLPDNNKLKEVKVVDSRITKKLKEAALTVESLDIISIKETPSLNFYDALGALKGVDITAASLGFKIINTRGFNSTSPVRSLQIIDGVDNQAPGLNFALGNFLGSSELDIQKVEIIQGASSSYFGPNAFNGVINMTTQNPFIYPGLTIQYKFGTRRLFENSFRLAKNFENKEGEKIFAFKINFSYMRAYDWEANNLSSVNGSTSSLNPGGYDAINRYGDEDTDGNLNDVSEDFNLNYLTHPGLGKFYRTGYLERDIVDYNTKNIKTQSSLHYMLNPETEIIYALNYSTGTTVYQGDNRFSLKDIQFWQNKIEIKKKNNFFIRAYRTQEDAGNSYDAVFTALKLQEYNTINNQEWYSMYKNNWKDNFSWEEVNWSTPEIIFNPITFETEWIFNGQTIDINDWILMSDSVLNANMDLIINKHNTTRDLTDIESNRLVPGTDEFKNALDEITTKTSYLYGGTGFYDKSALNHVHGEYQFNPSIAIIKVGANIRQYAPDSKGSIFMDTNTNIINNEFGIYSGFETEIINKHIKINSTVRIDKNENFDANISPAASIVFKPNNNDILRLSFSSAIRNPTLSDQYLFYNAGRAILIGNLNGHGKDYGENLVTIESLINYFLPATQSKDSLKFFSIDPIQPEKAKTIELGYRTTILNKVYIDANYYYSKYKDFIGYKIGAKYNTLLDDSITGAYQIALPSIQPYRISANAKNMVTTQGASIGIIYYINPTITLNGNYSWNKLNEEGTEDPIIPAFNTPEHKYNIGLTGREIHLSSTKNFFRNYGFSINYKWVDNFKYEGSPQFTGDIPSYDIIDLQLSKKLLEINADIKVGASNLLNNRHFEVYGGPYIGRMFYCSLIFNIK